MNLTIRTRILNIEVETLPGALYVRLGNHCAFIERSAYRPAGRVLEVLRKGQDVEWWGLGLKGTIDRVAA